MISIRRNFEEKVLEYTKLSSIICFVKTVRYRKFKRLTIIRWFNILVDKGDYKRHDVKLLIKFFLEKTNEVEEHTF